MKNLLPLSERRKARLFWDVDISAIDAESSSRLIIERIFALGTIEEIRTAIDFYGREKTLGTLLKLNYLDPKTLNFISRLFNKPKKEFRCYTKKQSTPQHWSS